MITALIIDDEPHATETLQWLLEQYCVDVQVLGICHSGESGLKAIEIKRPNLVFLDVEMPQMNGFDVLNRVKKLESKIIFTTAYDKYAIKAFKVSAVDYLLKPIDRDELMAAVRKVQNTIKDHQIDGKLQNLIDQLNIKKRLALSTLEGLIFVDLNQISHCDSDGSYTLVHFNNTKSLTICRSLKKIEQLLPSPPFIRVHHSHVVNLIFVNKYIRGSGGYLVMNNGQHINVSRSKKEELLKMISDM